MIYAKITTTAIPDIIFFGDTDAEVNYAEKYEEYIQSPATCGEEMWDCYDFLSSWEFIPVSETFFYKP